MTIAKDDQNPGFYAVTNWTTTTLGPEFPVIGFFDEATGQFQLCGYYFGNLESGEEFHYSAICQNGQNLTVITAGEGSYYPGVIATLKADKQSASAVGADIETNNGVLKSLGMEFFAIDRGTGSIKSFAAAEGFEVGDFVVGPFTMTKTGAANVMKAVKVARELPARGRMIGALPVSLDKLYVDTGLEKPQPKKSGVLRSKMFLSPSVMQAVQAR